MISAQFRYPCEPQQLGDDQGRIASYARGDDYHRVLKRLMSAQSDELRRQYGRRLRLRAITDSAPMHERHQAWRMGLGWFGRQGSIISAEHGAASLLAELVLDVPIERDVTPHPDRCGSCRDCVLACPTGAIAPEGYRVDSRRCISYWTIEWRGLIPRWIMERMGDRIFGCDDCTVICPWNRKASAPIPSALAPRPENIAPDLLSLLACREPEQLERRFPNSPVTRPGAVGFVRNVLIALARAPSDRVHSALLQFAHSDESPVLRATAVWSAHRCGLDIDFAVNDPAAEVRGMAEALLSGRPSEPPSPDYPSESSTF